MLHINFSVGDDDTFASCAGCDSRVGLPHGRGSLDDPPKRRIRAGSGHIEVTPCHPGTQIPIQSPRWQALADFILAHEACR